MERGLAAGAVTEGGAAVTPDAVAGAIRLPDGAGATRGTIDMPYASKDVVLLPGRAR